MAKVIRIPKGASPESDVVERAESPRAGTPFRPTSGPRVAKLIPLVGWARLEADDEPRLTLLCELGDGFPHVVQGYGGFDEVDRHANVSLTTWRGVKPLRIELPLWIDDLANERSIEPEIEVLEALAGRGRKRDNPTGAVTKPPQVIVHTAGLMPHDAHVLPDLRWYVDDLDWDDEQTIVNDHGNRVRTAVTVNLLQAVADERLADRALAARRRIQAQRGHKGARRRYTVKQGENLITIARKQLGDPGRVDELLKLNDLRDPRAVKAGAVLKLP